MSDSFRLTPPGQGPEGRREGPIGACQAGNLLVWGLGLYLFWPAFRHVSAHPILWSYSWLYLGLATAIAAGLLAWLGMVLTLPLRGQRALFFTTAALFVVLEGVFRLDAVQRRVAPLFADRGDISYPVLGATRDRFDEKGAKPGEYRVFVLGGSTVKEGEPSLPEALEELFHAQGRPEARVYNYGVDGAKSRQETLLLLTEVLDARPDLVVVLDGGNNAYEPWFGDPRPGYPDDWAAFESGYSLIAGKASFRRAVSCFLRGSALLRSLLDDAVFKEDLTGARKLRERAGYGTDEWRASLAGAWRADWEKMLLLAQARGVRIALVLQPALTEKASLDEAEKSVDAKLDDALRDHMRGEYVLMREGVGAMAASSPKGAVVAELSRALDDFSGQAFTDALHLTPGANRHLARKIFDLLAPLTAKAETAPAAATDAASPAQ